MHSLRKTAALLLVLAGSVLAQQVGQNTTPGAKATATFTVGTQLVIETVSVKDKSGKPIEGLTAKDFNITEDGVAQPIKFFEFQRLQEAVDTPSTPLTSRAQPFAKLTR